MTRAGIEAAMVAAHTTPTPTATSTPAIPGPEIAGLGAIVLVLCGIVVTVTVWLQTVTGGRLP